MDDANNPAGRVGAKGGLHPPYSGLAIRSRSGPKPVRS